MRALILSVCLLGAAPASTNAASINEMMKDVPKSYYLQGLIKGLGNGFGWANARLHNDGQKELFCAPENMALNVDNYTHIIKDQISTSPKMGEYDMSLLGHVMLAGLMRTFPCAATG